MKRAGFTLLVVEDELDAREGLSLLLEIEGYAVVQAANGQEALDRLKSVDRLPSVILLDLAMPIMDGPGFLAQRARDLTLAAVPVIVLSASKPDNQVIALIEEYLPKPVDPARLLKSISQMGGETALSSQD